MSTVIGGAIVLIAITMFCLGFLPMNTAWKWHLGSALFYIGAVLAYSAVF